jgi:hypothetical protein
MMATPKTDALLRNLNYGEPDDGYPLWAREMRELEEQNAELVEALEWTTALLNDPGLDDIDAWKAQCKYWTAQARAVLAKVKGS